MDCLLCHRTSTQFDVTRGKRIPTKHPADVSGLICGGCTQKLLSMSGEQVAEAYQLASEKDEDKKARVFQRSLAKHRGKENGNGTREAGIRKLFNGRSATRVFRDLKKST